MQLDTSVMLDVVLEYLKQKDILTDLEKDIISTIKKCNEVSFDRKGAEQKIDENNLKYMDIVGVVQSTLGGYMVPFVQLSDMDIKNNLWAQIEALCMKEYAIINNKSE